MKIKSKPVLAVKPNPSIFREYDIRGVADRDLPSDVVHAIGQAFGTQLRHANKKVVSIGHDCRVSSPRIEKALVDGITSTGIDVKRVGKVTTPALYFSIVRLKTDGGIMVTGSHNPPDQNGLKICIGTSSMHGSEIQGLYKLIGRGTYLTGKGKVTNVEILTAYSNEIAKNVKLDRKLSVVVDCANGMTGLVAPKVFKKMGCSVAEMYTKPDGRFPNHAADPSVPKNLEDIIVRVKKEKPDVGFAFDGDGDRVGVIDEKGESIFSDRLMILLSRAVLSEKPGATILGDVKCTNLLFEDIKKHGGKPLMWKTGHSLIKAKMKEVGAELGGEMSGHIFFKHRWYGFDSGIYTAARVLEILSKTKKTLSVLLADIPRTFSTPEIRVECSDETKFDVVREATEFFKRQKMDVNDIDGARVTFKDGWGLLRASNTQPVIVMRFEADSAASLEKIRELVEGKLNEILHRGS
ncbi:MAG: phosphomannomutase/phosphoglucomutase [Candidatus Omnitrophica bacterium]|nr:phosphomannomutase/phosphoglucomutase [Candidatus Omnitrophota bacterium]